MLRRGRLIGCFVARLDEAPVRRLNELSSRRRWWGDLIGGRVAFLAVSAFVAAAALGSHASVAQALEHNWSCPNRNSGDLCADTVTYHSWVAIQERIDYFLNAPSICAWGQTAAGNIRTGSGCDSNDWVRTSCLSSETPLSWGYGRWYWSGHTHDTAGYAATPSNNLIC